MTVYRINVTHREIGEPTEYVTEVFDSYEEAKARIRYINTNERWIRVDNWVEEIQLEEAV